MSSKQQMKRGKNQALYKYLPETWIDFSVRGKERKLILSILVDTFISKISLTMQPGPKIDSISGA